MSSKPIINEKFIIRVQGSEFVKYEGLLDLAHQKGLKSISTRIIQLPNKENGNTCIVKAICKTEDGNEFHGIGDAAPNSVNRMIVPHLIRMAETRAKARALRDLTNVGMTAFEEITTDEEPVNSNGYRSNRNNNDYVITEAQLKRLYAIANKAGVNSQKVQEHVFKRFKKKPEELTKSEYDIVCAGYESKANKGA